MLPTHSLCSILLLPLPKSMKSNHYPCTGKAAAGAGFFLDTPILTTTLSTVSHVDSGCNNITSSTAKNAIYDTLTHISTSAEIALGVIAQAEVNFPGAGDLQDEAKHTVLSTAFHLPTGCVGYDVDAKTYGAVDAVKSTATGTETAVAGAKPSQSVGSVGVLGMESPGFGRMMMAFVALIGVCTGFALF